MTILGLRNKLYGHLPYNEEDRQRMLRWNLLEAKCDVENVKTIESMDLSHLNKTRTKDIEKAMKQWKKSFSDRKKKILESNTNSTTATKHIWIRDE
jgi:hypothetical protein